MKNNNNNPDEYNLIFPPPKNVGERFVPESRVRELESKLSLAYNTVRCVERERDEAKAATFQLADTIKCGAIRCNKLEDRLAAAERRYTADMMEEQKVAKSYPGIHGESFSPIEAFHWYEEQIASYQKAMTDVFRCVDWLHINAEQAHPANVGAVIKEAHVAVEKARKMNDNK